MAANLENQIRCSLLEGDINNARANIVSFTDHIARLEQDIQIQQGLVQNLKRQMERTGDETFGSDIQTAEDRIAQLQRQIAESHQTISQWENELRNKIEEYRNSGCDGSIGI